MAGKTLRACPAPPGRLGPTRMTEAAMAPKIILKEAHRSSHETVIADHHGTRGGVIRDDLPRAVDLKRAAGTVTVQVNQPLPRDHKGARGSVMGRRLAPADDVPPMVDPGGHRVTEASSVEVVALVQVGRTQFTRRVSGSLWGSKTQA